MMPFDDGFSTAGFRNRAEGWFSGPQLHNLVHVWVGGSMLPASSPNDPVFFLHHCFVDKLWADWQRLHPTEGYLPISPIVGKPGHSLNEAMEPWAGRGQTITPASVLDHHALGYGYDTEAVCAPTLKFRDDITLKFRDDITLKFRDDITLKFNDDPGTLKFRDDITLKFRDDVKQPGLDKPPLTDVKQPSVDKAPGADVVGTPAPGGFRQGVPFVLSTPHHSMAWAQSFPQAHRATLDQYAAAIAEYEQMIQEINQAAESGQLSEAEMQAADTLFREYQALTAEYQQLIQQT
jgi:hypothetical protein